jgi:hypothetical protein
MSEIEKELNDKYGKGRESIKDLGEALNLLSIYGKECALCIDPSIRAQAYEEFKKIEKKPNT